MLDICGLLRFGVAESRNDEKVGESMPSLVILSVVRSTKRSIHFGES